MDSYLSIFGGNQNGEEPKTGQGTSLSIQQLGLCISAAGDTGLIPGRGTKIPHAM